MTAQTFQYQRYPAEQARRLLAGPSWGRRFVLGLTSGLVLLLGGTSFWTFEPRQVAIALVAAGLALLVFSVVALAIWFRQGLRQSAGRPWGRLLAASLLAVWALDVWAVQQHAYELAANLNAVQWALAVSLLLRIGWLARRRPPRAEAAIWAAGAAGEDLVARELTVLDENHIVIHNLPLRGHGDADHVVVGPAGVLVMETKYLAGRITCLSDGTWTQTRRDGTRQIPDPAAQVQRAVGAVHGSLARRRLAGVPVRCVLVLAHPRADLDVAKSPVPVVRPAGLVPLIERLAESEPHLEPRSVTAVANALMTGRRSDAAHAVSGAARGRGQALVEFTCALGVLLVLAFGMLGVARVTGALIGLTAVAREAARAGARAPDQATALAWATDRGQQVAADYGLADVALDIDTSSFEMQPSAGLVLPGEIRVAASLAVDVADVPLVSWTQVRVPLERAFAEVVDPYRSAPPPADGGGA